jgi:hypothetical protein
MKITCFLILLFSFFTRCAYAGTAVGKVNYYAVQAGNLFFFTVNAKEAGKPVCNTANAANGKFAVSTVTQTGKDIMTAVVNAKNANFTINVKGSGTCTTSPSSENVNYVVVTGTSAAKSIAVCVRDRDIAAACSCSSGITKTRQITNNTCTVTSETGSCTASGSIVDGNQYRGSCCVCG